ncbi:MAG: GvpL/GvpF family gas vesicle protein [Isosphaeraceae bacterium]
MSRPATYLYCVARSGAEIPDGLSGIEEQVPVQILECAELAVVTSVVERDVFESDAPSDPEWVVPRALRHERVVETVLSRGPILPVRFGALFATRQALMAWVAANRAAISGFLDHVSDKEEWTVRIHVELGTALDILMAREPDWIARARALPSSPGTRYFQEKKLRADAQRHVRQTARVATERFRAEARKLAGECLLSLRKSERPDIEPVLHSAYLVPRRSVPTFLELINQAGKKTACLRLESTGPWPPSHFCPRLDLNGSVTQSLCSFVT